MTVMRGRGTKLSATCCHVLPQNWLFSLILTHFLMISAYFYLNFGIFPSRCNKKYIPMKGKLHPRCRWKCILDADINASEM